MLNPETTALLVIDMQKDAVERLVPTGAQAVPAIAQALKAARTAGITVIFGLRVLRANGDDVANGAGPTEDHTRERRTGSERSKRGEGNEQSELSQRGARGASGMTAGDGRAG